MTSYTPLTGPARGSLAKDVALRWIDSHSVAIIKLSDRIWTLAELSLREWRSAFSAAEVLRKSGFRIDWGLGGFPCAFVATFGSGGPVLGFNAEYDALPGLSQKAGVSIPDPLVYHYDADGPAYGSGHGNAHNALTAGTVAAAIAVAQAITMHGLRATVKVIATSGDEQLVGKTHLVKAGVYDGLDVFLDWRPFDATRAVSSPAGALSSATFTFRAAGPDPTGLSPHPGLDGALVLADLAERNTTTGPSGQVHYAIHTAAGVAPDLASIRFLLRESSPSGLQVLYGKILSYAREAAAVTGVTLIHQFHTATWNGLANKVGAELVNNNMVTIGAPVFTAEDQAFARGVQRALNRPEVGLPTSVTPPSPPRSSSRDDLDLTTADVSWQAPTVTALVATFPTGVPRRTWAATAAAGGNIGHQGLLSAARYLSATAVDLIAQPQLLGAMTTEFDLRTTGISWKSLLPAGSQPPVYEPPVDFLRKTGQAWPPEVVSWPVPEVGAGHALTATTGRQVLNLR